MQPTIKVAVTRHAGLLTLAREKGLLADGCRVVEGNASPGDVKNQDVFGILPLRLAAEARSVTELPLELPFELRGKDLSVDECRVYARGAAVFAVFRRPENPLRDYQRAFSALAETYTDGTPRAEQDRRFRATRDCLAMWHLPQIDLQNVDMSMCSAGLMFGDGSYAADEWVAWVLDSVFGVSRA